MLNTTKNNFTQQAMYYGTLLGALWVAKFPFYIIGVTKPTFATIFLTLTLVSPFIAGYFVVKYRKRECNNHISFTKAWWFLLIIYMCASLLSAIAHFIYFVYIDNNFLIPYLQEQLNLFFTSQGNETVYSPEVKEAIELMGKIGDRDLVFQLLTSNLFFAIFISPITALFVYKRDKNYL